MNPTPHRVSYTVYYEDTDCLQVVYYANYFKYFERGRTEFLAASGHQVAALNAAGLSLVVSSAAARFKAPARLGDQIDVVSTFALASPYRGVFSQRIERSGKLLVTGTIDIVCLNAAGSLIRLPDSIAGLASQQQ